MQNFYVFFTRCKFYVFYQHPGGYEQLVGVCYRSENKKIIGTENDMQLLKLITELKGNTLKT